MVGSRSQEGHDRRRTATGEHPGHAVSTVSDGHKPMCTYDFGLDMPFDRGGDVV